MDIDYNHPHCGKKVYEDPEHDMTLTQAQLDLILAALNGISHPKYFSPPYDMAYASWRVVTARKRHIDDFGNEIRSGEDYLSYGRFTPTRISLRSTCGLWSMLMCTPWLEVIHKKYMARQKAPEVSMGASWDEDFVEGE